MIETTQEPPATVSTVGAPHPLVRFLGNKWVLRAVGLVAVLAVWELWFSNINPIFSAPPSKVAAKVPKVITSEEYLPALASTIRLFGLGYGIAIVIGVPLGLGIARSRLLDTAITPYLNAIYASPVPAIIPILTAILGFQLTAKVVVVVLLAVFPILINANQGAKSVDPTIIEVARSFRVREARLWRDVIVPSSLPYLLVGLRLGAARGMIGTAVAELYTSPDGLGYLIHRYGYRFEMDGMLVVVLTFTAISLVFSLSLGALEHHFERWRVKSQ
ncbi:MAG TPA: ABC transporter permease [Actinomycetota bacterium]|nr:ABC transporter permease [Actinomycetota bacterium]